MAQGLVLGPCATARLEVGDDHAVWINSARTGETMTQDDDPKDVVTVMRLVPLRRADGTSGESAIAASFASARVRTEGDAIFLVVPDAHALGGFKVGDILHWIGEPFGIVWRAEYPADAPDRPPR